jgi:hypothetical protein
MSWKPRLRDDVDLRQLSLNVEHGSLLSWLDGTFGLDDLALLTGIASERLHVLLQEMQNLGALEAIDEVKTESVKVETHDEVKTESADANASGETNTEAVDEEAETTEAEAEAESETESASEDTETALTHRSLFEQKLHHLPVDEREAQVRGAEEPELSAYCFDPMPQVIHGLFQNPKAGLRHARLVAANHRTASGLETLASNAAFAGDTGVRRALLQNPILPTSLYRRLWNSRRLQEQYLVAISREVPEQTRSMARELLRANFAQRSAEEKTELILKTEGRCLLLLVGLTVDGHTTALLCRRTYVSTLLIQNIARWSAAPPQLIAHLLRQDVVRRNAQLRLLLERHPNANA